MLVAVPGSSPAGSSKSTAIWRPSPSFGAELRYEEAVEQLQTVRSILN